MQRGELLARRRNEKCPFQLCAFLMLPRIAPQFERMLWNCRDIEMLWLLHENTHYFYVPHNIYIQYQLKELVILKVLSHFFTVVCIKIKSPAEVHVAKARRRKIPLWASCSHLSSHHDHLPLMSFQLEKCKTLFLFFEMDSHYAAQASLELTILPSLSRLMAVLWPQPLEWRDYRHAQQYLASMRLQTECDVKL